MLTTMKRTGLRALASTASLQNHADGDHIDYQAVDAVVLGQQYSETNHLAITTTPFTKEGHMPLSS